MNSIVSEFGHFIQTRERCSDIVNPESLTLENTKVVTKGSSVPRYKQRIRDMSSASSAYAANGTTHQIGRFSAYEEWDHASCGRWRNEWEHPFSAGYPPSLPLMTSECANAAYSRFMSNASRAAAPLASRVTLGELAETLGMIRNPARSLRDYLKGNLHCICKGDKPPYKVKKAPRCKAVRGKVRCQHVVLADTFLEWVYGWMPLAYDIADGLEAYANVRDRVRVRHCTGTDFIDVPVSNVTTGPYLQPNSIYYYIDAQSHTELRCRYRGAFKSHIEATTPSPTAIAREIRLFDLSSIPSDLWELTTYSFVIDMFSNVGDILSAIHAITLDWIYITRSDLRKAVASSTYRYAPQFAPYWINDSNGTCSEAKRERWDYNRVPTTADTLPGLQFSLPGGFSWAKLSALITARWGSR